MVPAVHSCNARGQLSSPHNRGPLHTTWCCAQQLPAPCATPIKTATARLRADPCSAHNVFLNIWQRSSLTSSIGCSQDIPQAIKCGSVAVQHDFWLVAQIASKQQSPTHTARSPLSTLECAKWVDRLHFTTTHGVSIAKHRSTNAKIRGSAEQPNAHSSPTTPHTHTMHHKQLRHAPLWAACSSHGHETDHTSTSPAARPLADC
ncbi:hypothetical protein COO60DRAFT_1488210 [Scenedesmus sp. NREL 46B-D3]|nr:hypothetical protein COO60DRAFT_1488210 [Scenedesmus sp. NREL 46B-D3]